MSRNVNGASSSEAVPVGDRILNALEDPRWNWRTVDGISRDTGIPPDEVRVFLTGSGGTVVRSIARDRQGRSLFTTRKRYRKSHSLMERLLDHYRITST